MSKLSDKLNQAIAAMPKESVVWQSSFSFSGRMFGKSNYALEAAKSQIHRLADSEVHALQIIDLAENRAWLLEKVAERLARGDDVEPIIEKLLDGLRHEPETFEEMVESVQPKQETRLPDWLYHVPMGGA